MELDETGQPTQRIIENRRIANFITPIPKPKKRKSAAQSGFVFDEGKGLSTTEQQYDPTSIICKQEHLPPSQLNHVARSPVIQLLG
jgi:type III restriction enzyme